MINHWWHRGQGGRLEGGHGLRRCGQRRRPGQSRCVIPESGGRGGLTDWSQLGHLPWFQCSTLEEEGNIGVETAQDS